MIKLKSGIKPKTKITIKITINYYLLQHPMKYPMKYPMKKISIALLFLFALQMSAQQKVWSLKECVEYALENNITVKQSELDVKLQEENVRTAKGNFYPNLNANASQSWNFGSFIGQSGARISSDTRSNSFGIGTSVNIFNGFSNKNTLEQAKIGVESQNTLLEKMRNDISLNVVNAYLQILFAKEQIKINQAQLNLNKEELTRVNQLVEAGTRPQGDALDIESNLVTSQQNLVSAKNALLTAKVNLVQLLQLDTIDIEVANIDAELNETAIMMQSTDTILEKALSFLPEMRTARLNVDSAERAINIAKSSKYPTLSFSYNLGTNYQHAQGRKDELVIPDTSSPTGFRVIDNDFFTQLDNNLGHNLGFNLSIPIFNRFQIKSSINRANINFEKAKYNLDNQKIQLRSTIQNAYVNAHNAQKTYEAAKKTVEARQQAFNFARERYNVGMMNSFDFSQSNNQLISSQSQLVRAKYDYAFKTKILEFYFGIPLTE